MVRGAESKVHEVEISVCPSSSLFYAKPMADHPMGKVILCDEQGAYLCGELNGRFFGRNRLDAAILDHDRDNVENEVDRLWREERRRCIVISVDPPDRYELCDGCRCRVMPVKAFFTGDLFLCPECTYYWSRARLPGPRSNGQLG